MRTIHDVLHRRVLAVLVATSATASIIGCGGQGAGVGKAQIVATSPGPSIGGSVLSVDGAFRTSVPHGFTYSAPVKTPPGGADIQYVASTPNDKAFESITVTRRSLGHQTQSAAAAAVVGSLRHAPGVSQTTALTPAPAPTGAQSWQFRSGPPGAPPEIAIQTFIAHRSALYIVMATAPASHRAAIKKSAATILKAWRWT